MNLFIAFVDKSEDWVTPVYAIPCGSNLPMLSSGGTFVSVSLGA